MNHSTNEELMSLRSKVKDLEEWKSAILSVLNANGYQKMDWAGNKEGWGAAFEYIAWAFREITILTDEIRFLNRDSKYY